MASISLIRFSRSSNSLFLFWSSVLNWSVVLELDSSNSLYFVFNAAKASFFSARFVSRAYFSFKVVWRSVQRESRSSTNAVTFLLAREFSGGVSPHLYMVAQELNKIAQRADVSIIDLISFMV